MFGWFRKRERDAQLPLEAAPAPRIEAPDAAATRAGHEPGRPETEREHRELAPAAPAIVLAAPSRRPAMPLADRPNVAGAAADLDAELPRLLSPTAALGEEAREQLTALLADMFGARGRYRLEWRADRQPGDDAMFSEIMVADLVRRIQNTLGEVAALEGDAARPAIAAAPLAESGPVDAEPVDAELVDADPVIDEDARQRAIESFLSPADETGELAAIATPDVSETAPASQQLSA